MMLLLAASNMPTALLMRAMTYRSMGSLSLVKSSPSIFRPKERSSRRNS